MVASSEDSKGGRKLRLQAAVKVEGHSWLAARCSGPGYEQSVQHFDGWGRGIMAHTSPVYLACGGEWWMFNQETAQYMLTLVDGSLHYIRHNSRQHLRDDITHHHGEADHPRLSGAALPASARGDPSPDASVGRAALRPPCWGILVGIY